MEELAAFGAAKRARGMSGSSNILSHAALLNSGGHSTLRRKNNPGHCSGFSDDRGRNLSRISSLVLANMMLYMLLYFNTL